MRGQLARDRPVRIAAAGLLLGLAAAPAPAGTLAGAFSVNNDLPLEAELRVEAWPGEAEVAAAAHPAAAEGGRIPYRFEDLDPASYVVRLVAESEEGELALAETAVVEVGREGEAQGPHCEAIGSRGVLAGRVRVSGEIPSGRMLFVSARRTDMVHEGFMPDALNYLSFELEREDLEKGEVEYRFDGAIFGVYRVQLTGYDFETHQTRAYGVLPEAVAVDLRHPEHGGLDFEADFAAAAE